MRDYVRIEQEYNKEALCYKLTLRDSICLVGENHKTEFKKYFPREDVAENLTTRQKYKLGIKILYKCLHKTCSKRKIRKSIYLGCHRSQFDDMFDFTISTSSSKFSKILSCINENLTEKQKSGLSVSSHKYLRYEKLINKTYIYLAPIHCDIIITSAGIIESKYKQIGKYLIDSVRI